MGTCGLRGCIGEVEVVGSIGGLCEVGVLLFLELIRTEIIVHVWIRLRLSLYEFKSNILRRRSTSNIDQKTSSCIYRQKEEIRKIMRIDECLSMNLSSCILEDRQNDDARNWVLVFVCDDVRVWARLSYGDVLYNNWMSILSRLI